jgi:hypothetical protein
MAFQNTGLDPVYFSILTTFLKFFMPASPFSTDASGTSSSGQTTSSPLKSSENIARTPLKGMSGAQGLAAPSPLFSGTGNAFGTPGSVLRRRGTGFGAENNDAAAMGSPWNRAAASSNGANTPLAGGKNSVAGPETILSTR